MAATANSVITPQAVKTANATCTAAKTSYADNVNAVLLLTAGANGSVLYGLTAIPKSTLAADNKVMLFRSRDAGTTLNYVKSVNVTAYAADAASTKPTVADFGFSEGIPLRLGVSEALYVGTFAAAANGVVVDAQYEDL